MSQKLYFILQNGNCVHQGGGTFSRRFPVEFINSYNIKYIHFIRGHIEIENKIVSNISFHANIVQKNTDYDNFIGILGVVYDGRKKWKQMYTVENIEFHFRTVDGQLFVPDRTTDYNYIIELMLEY